MHNMRQLKIGIVCYPTFGGSGVVATELGKALAEKGHEIHFITYSQPVRLGSLRKNVRYHEVNVSDYPLFLYPPYELVLASKMVDVALHEKLDLLHVHYAIPHASAAYMAKQILKANGHHLPFITTLHGTDITLLGRDASFEPVISFAINESDAVTAVSQSLKTDTYKLFGINKEIQVVPNFIEPQRISNEIKQALREEYVSEGNPMLIHISNFRPVKRVMDVMQVFAKVREQRNATLVLIGDGPERSKAEQYAREHQLQNVVFVGNVKNPMELLTAADVMLLPSESESFGLAALEAMACGVPVISSNAGGLPELNRHGVSGLMSDVGDVNEMAKQVLYLIESPDRLNKFKQQAKEQSESFNLQAVLPQYEAIYEHVLSHE
ncbi:MAG: N-acetyl-alpha-D-glucosaminyl L-malate synthase BshA [Bacteroidetes bacterium]|nr:N-acetyl-alpha-D-glucosaminyl L-malate synthase BshA [Bacteroidota bacterium]